MTKKQLSIRVFIFLLGFITGGASIASYFGQSIINSGEILSMHFRAAWGSKAFQAYSEENPQVAIWALENFADILEGHLELTEDNTEITQKDLVLTYTRLAIVSQTVKDTQKYYENISKALTISKQVYSDVQTEEALLSFVKKVDRIAN